MKMTSQRITTLAIWGAGLVLGCGLISASSPLRALQGGSEYLLFADQGCPYSKIAVAHVEAHGPAIVTIPVRYTDESWGVERCAAALDHLRGAPALLWRDLMPRSVACRRLVGEAGQWLATHSEHDGLPAWSQGQQWLGIGVKPEALARVGLPPLGPGEE